MGARLNKGWGHVSWVTVHASPQREGEKTRPRWVQNEGRGREGKNNRTSTDNGRRPTPFPPPRLRPPPLTVRVWLHRDPILPRLLLNGTNSPLHVFIYIQKATPKGDNQTHAWIKTLASYWPQLQSTRLTHERSWNEDCILYVLHSFL